MKIIGKRCFRYFLFLSILMAATVFRPANGLAETIHPLPPDPSSRSEALIASLSDEQVRQMLISELRKDVSEEQYSRQQEHMVGPAGLLNRILQKITIKHDDNEKQFRQLLSGIPDVLPDLHKVFLHL